MEQRNSTRGANGKVDATTLLRADHKLVSELFEQFEKSRSPEKKRALVEKICQELTIHAQVEEEIFYPAVKAALGDSELVPEARVEHETLKTLVAQLEGAQPDGEDYDARVKVLSEYVKHHVKEDQSEMFPKAKASTKLDMKALGQALLTRKEELKAQFA
jgi:hemerythrin superfamily protein